MEDRLRELAFVDNVDDGLEFFELGGDQPAVGYELCLVGNLVTDRSFHLQ